jgi:MurNAc alpha-1-phosphate uridylyltransferase
MILAAGKGLRMRPLTERIPKPLVEVGGRCMLDRVIDHLDAVGVPHRVVNAHWLAEQIHRHLAGRGDTLVSDESESLLETGGGMVKALPLLGDGPFYACNADIIWQDGPVPALRRLAEAWDDAAMDALLLLQPTANAFGYQGAGDYFREDSGRARRRRGDDVSPLLFAGVQILHPRLFAAAPEGAFSTNLLWDRAEQAGRLFALIHDGAWYHVDNPAAIPLAEARLAATAGG